MKKLTVAISCWLCLVFLTGPVLAQSPVTKAEKLVKEGYTSFKKGEYRSAIRFFKESYQIVKHPLRLQNIARCYELLSDYYPAVLYYLQYAVAVETPAEVTDTNTRLLPLVSQYLILDRVIPADKIREFSQALDQKNRLRIIPVFYLIAGISFGRQQNYPEALTQFEKAITYEVIRGHQRVYSIALDWLEISKKKVADLFRLKQIKALVKEGDSFALQKEYAKALYKYRSAVALNPPDALKVQIQRIITELQTVKQQEEEKQRALHTVIKNKRIKGWSLLATGIVGLIGASALFAFTQKSAKSAEQYYQEYEDLVNSRASQERIDEKYSEFETNRRNMLIYVITASILSAGSITMLSFGIYYLAASKSDKSLHKEGEGLFFSPAPYSQGKWNNLLLNYRCRF